MEKTPLHARAVRWLAYILPTPMPEAGSGKTMPSPQLNIRRFHEGAQNHDRSGSQQAADCRQLRYLDRRRFRHSFGLHRLTVINVAGNILPVGISLRNIEWFL
jgi:hypothetical protein